MDLGTYIDYDGRPAVRFERTYPHSIDRVWEAVTRPEVLARWFPSGVSHEAQVGGTIEFHGDPYSDPSTGEILEFEPPTRFAYTWGPDELHFELEQIGESCRLVLVNVLAERNTAARNASGWHVCLAELEKVLASESSSGPHGAAADAAFEDTMAKYVAAGVPSGAEIPEQRD